MLSRLAKSLSVPAFCAVLGMGSAADAYEHIVGGPGRDGVRKMSRLSDGGLAVIGWQAQEGIYGDGAAALLRMDATGNVSWSRALTSTGHNQGAAVAELENGHLVISLEEYPDENGPGQVILVELDATGVPMDQTPVGGPGKEVADVVLPLGDSLLLGGERSADPDGDMDAWVTLLDADHTALWEWTRRTSGRDRINALIPLSDGSLIAAGNSTTPDGEKHQEQALFARLNSDGSETWVKEPKVDRPASIRGLARLPDDSVVFAGFSKRLDTGEFDGWIGRISAAGDVLWHTPLPDNGPAFLHSVIILESGDALAAGAIRPTGAPGYNGLLVRFSPDGTIHKETQVERSGSAQIRSVKQTKSTTIVLGGSFTPEGTKNEQLWLTEVAMP